MFPTAPSQRDIKGSYSQPLKWSKRNEPVPQCFYFFLPRLLSDCQVVTAFTPSKGAMTSKCSSALLQISTEWEVIQQGILSSSPLPVSLDLFSWLHLANVSTSLSHCEISVQHFLGVNLRYKRIFLCPRICIYLYNICIKYQSEVNNYLNGTRIALDLEGKVHSVLHY